MMVFMNKRPMSAAESRKVTLICRFTSNEVLSQKFWWNSGWVSMCVSLSWMSPGCTGSLRSARTCW
ncbi:hypothetical protein PF010_g29419 [Phytophthora fragariae]|uniref:Uncharacterized protein n=1 Tax=Phytophthora fragariae TaxID=53985 RepID=A0A6A4BCS3_9STRA|nr:hypothetical protein PF010_g29419 [Phytophthora fragariae]KAE9268857.1 hypothetical protein PF001_g29479 [Phytophthora fragariae]KAE9275781.1 hypothetical protein PF008_g29260 [Phytophthora fragariae]